MNLDLSEKKNGLSFELSEDHQLICNSVRDFAERHIAPDVIERDRKKEFPHEIINMLADQGLLGIYHDEEYGGAGFDTVSFCLALEEIARWDASIALSVASHTSLASGHIALTGNHHQKKRYLTPLARGEKLGGWCLTEPGSGSDSSKLKTTATKNGDHWVINQNLHYAGIYKYMWYLLKRIPIKVQRESVLLLLNENGMVFNRENRFIKWA